MRPDEEVPKRRSIRIQGYDYSQGGAYFVTICAHRKRLLFGRVTAGTVRLNDVGNTVAQYWEAIPNHVAQVIVDEYVVMPNHFHGILIISDDSGWPVAACHSLDTSEVSGGPACYTHQREQGRQRLSGPKPGSVGSIVRAFKSAVTRAMRQRASGITGPIWQRNYYEHVIRDESGLNRIREYIRTNPMRWERDREHPNPRGADDFDLWLDSFKELPK